jgi:hypothetical protein
MTLRLLALSVSLVWAAPAVATPKYDRVPVQTMATKQDRAFASALKTLRLAVARKDRRAVYALLASKFVIERDFGGLTNPKLSARAQFDAALPGWDALARLSAAAQWGPWEKGSKLICGPAALSAADETRVIRAAKQRGDNEDDYWFEWVYVELDGVAVRKAPSFQAAAIASISREAVRALERKGDGWIKVALPDGREAFLSERVALTMFNDSLCLRNVGGKWRLAGYVGGGD